MGSSRAPGQAGFLTSRAAFPDLAIERTTPPPEPVAFSSLQPSWPRLAFDPIPANFATPSGSSNPVPEPPPLAGFASTEPWNPREINVHKAAERAVALLGPAPQMVRDLNFALEPRSTLVTLEFSPVTLYAIAPGAGQRILQAPLGFDFSREFPRFLPNLARVTYHAGVGLPVHVAPSAAPPPELLDALEKLSRSAHAAPYPDKAPLRFLRPIELRPAPPPKAVHVIPFAYMAPPGARPTLPAGTPMAFPRDSEPAHAPYPGGQERQPRQFRIRLPLGRPLTMNQLFKG